jgi:fructose-bisphosphate aldolase class I
MKPISDLGLLLKRAASLGVFGTKERSVIHLANGNGIGAVVTQQFDIADRVLDHGMVPIIEPEVNIKSPHRGAADRILLDELLDALETVQQPIMLKVSIPAEPGLFQP